MYKTLKATYDRSEAQNFTLHFLLYYNALIRPVINYASVLWTNCGKESLGWVLKLQKRAARVILNAPHLVPSVPLIV